MERADSSVTAPIRVLVVDDHRSFAEALALAIDAVPSLECVGIAGTAVEAFELAASARPDAVLLDLALPDLDGILVAEQLRADAPDCRVLVLTGGASGERMARAALAGVDGFLAKQASLRSVLDALVEPAAELYVDDVTLAMVLERPGEPPPGHARPCLTERERQVLQHLGAGTSVKAIAVALGISVNTCRGHIRSILSKLGVHSQLAAVVRASQLGLLTRPAAIP